MTTRVLASILGLLFALTSQAAIEVTVETTDLTRKDAKAELGRITIDGKKMAVRGKDADEVPQMIFRGDLRLLYAIDPSKKEYIEIEKETFDEMGGQVDEMMKKMERRLAEMPPQQRAMVERMMRDSVPDPNRTAPPIGKPMVKRTETRETISGYPCRLYEIHVDDQKVREIWVTPWSQVDHGREAFGIFRELEDFFEHLVEAMQSSPFSGYLRNPFDQVSKIDGFPVLTRDFKNGSAVRESLFKKVEVTELPAAAFEPPEGYEKKDPGEGVTRRRMQ